MLRSLISGVAITLIASSGALAQSCAGNPVAVQVLGSGAPGFVKDRANTSYLLWVGNQAKILVDAGGGAYVRFAQALHLGIRQRFDLGLERFGHAWIALTVGAVAGLALRGKNRLPRGCIGGPNRPHQGPKTAQNQRANSFRVQLHY